MVGRDVVPPPALLVEPQPPPAPPPDLLIPIIPMTELTRSSVLPPALAHRLADSSLRQLPYAPVGASAAFSASPLLVVSACFLRSAQ